MGGASNAGLTATVDGIEALAALDATGTASEAAARLRLTQSAVSKRLQALSRAVGFDVVAPSGRRLAITPRGLDLLARARPLLAGLRDLAVSDTPTAPVSLSLALADSIAASWGPAAVADALGALGGALRVELHAHRSVLLVEQVRMGRYQLGLCPHEPGAGAVPGDLVHHPVATEPMALVHAGLRPVPRGGALITIEAASATWRTIGTRLARRRPDLGKEFVRVESFAAALQMARAGFGDGLVPLGVALEARLPDGAWSALGDVARPIGLVSRKTVGQLPSFARFHAALVRAVAARLGAR